MKRTKLGVRYYQSALIFYCQKPDPLDCMNHDDSLARAFKTIQDTFGVGAFDAMPHPDNLKFRKEEEVKTMRRIGLQLADLAEGQDQQWSARIVQRYFWRELGHTNPVDLPPDVPDFLLPPDHAKAPYINTATLAQQMASVDDAQPATLCIVASKLSLLQQLLHLNDAETRYLKLAYVSYLHGKALGDNSHGLFMVMQNMGMRDAQQRDHVFATLLDEPIEAVHALFQPPSKLVALGFIDPACWHDPKNLRDKVIATDAFIALLEDKFRSHQALLAAILEPEYDVNLFDDGSPITVLYEWFPADIAACYECAVLERPMEAAHIKTIVKWFSSLDLEVALFAPLAGHLCFESIREGIKRATLECCTADKPVTALAILQALYANTGTLATLV